MKNDYSKTIITTTEGWFAKAPALPTNAKELLVKITPFIALIFGVLGVLSSVAGLGLLTAFSPLAAMGGGQEMSSYGNGFIVSLFWLVSSVLLLAAYPGVKAKKIKGWNLLFWSELVSLAGSVVGLNIISGIIGALIGFYLLFQIKSYYK